MGQDEWPMVLRYDFARNTFGSAQQAVGQHMILNGRAFVVIGVAHRRFPRRYDRICSRCLVSSGTAEHRRICISMGLAWAGS